MLLEKRNKWVMSIILGLIVSVGNRYGALIALVLCAILFDVSTGLIRGKIQQDINSRDGFRGFWKKIALLAALLFGFFIDFIEHYTVNYTELSVWYNIDVWIPFGHIIGIYIVINECISICENLYECGVKLPKLLQNALRKTSECIIKAENDLK